MYINTPYVQIGIKKLKAVEGTYIYIQYVRRSILFFIAFVIFFNGDSSFYYLLYKSNITTLFKKTYTTINKTCV